MFSADDSLFAITPSEIVTVQAISIDARKGVWVSAIFSFKTLLGYGLLLKR